MNQTSSGTDGKDTTIGDRIAIGVETPLQYGDLRTEFEIGLNTRAKIKSSPKSNLSEVMNVKADNTTYMLNTYYDYKMGTKLTPYVGFGFGIANMNVKFNYDSVLAPGQYMKGELETNNFTYNLGIGVSYVASEKISVDVGYRYTNFGVVKGPIKYNEKIGADSFQSSYVISHSKFSSQEVLCGVRYNFN
jgi:opacity protein-like surface antigen